MALVSRYFQGPGCSFFMFGPRGTGKSTWLNTRFNNSLYINLLAPDQFRAYAARPERIEELIDANPGKTPIIIDEVQKVPALLDVVHFLMEKEKQLRFILTGSSARKIRRAGVDLLAGRAVLKTMHPFMASEIGANFDLNNALTMGMLPLILYSDDPKAALDAYATLYIHEEIQAEGLIRNVGGFARFLEAISFSHGAMLNTSEVARECQVSRKTVEGYISILNDLLLSFLVPVFTKRAKRHLVAHSKFYFFDAGVFRSLRPAGPLDSVHEIDGVALEGLVAQHLRAWAAYSQQRVELFFWRTKSGNEVDFILYGPNCFHAIEVKNSYRIRSKDLNGLRAFIHDYPEAEALLLYRGKERLKKDRILCMPCKEFMQTLIPETSLPGISVCI